MLQKLLSGKSNVKNHNYNCSHDTSIGEEKALSKFTNKQISEYCTDLIQYMQQSCFLAHPLSTPKSNEPLNT